MNKYSGTKIILLSGLIVFIIFNVLLICRHVYILKSEEKNRVYNMIREDNIFEIFSESAIIDIEPLRSNLIDLINIDSISSPSILYLYAYNNCNNCIFTDIAALMNSPFFKKGNAMVIPNIEDTRDNRIKVASDLRNINYKIMSPDVLQLPFLNGEMTRLFILFKDGEFFYPFIPDSSYPEITEKYLEFTYNFNCEMD